MDDVPTMTRSGYHGSALGLNRHIVTSFRHRGLYVVLLCVRIRLFAMPPRPIASAILATTEAPTLRSPLTEVVSSHKRSTLFIRKGTCSQDYDYHPGSCRYILLWLTYTCGSGPMLVPGRWRTLAVLSASRTCSAGAWSFTPPCRLAQ